MWGGRGATARPREAEWSSGLAAVFWVCYNKNIFKDPNDYYDYDASVLYNKDMTLSVVDPFFQNKTPHFYKFIGVGAG